MGAKKSYWTFQNSAERDTLTPLLAVQEGDVANLVQEGLFQQFIAGAWQNVNFGDNLIREQSPEQRILIKTDGSAEYLFVRTFEQTTTDGTPQNWPIATLTQDGQFLQMEFFVTGVIDGAFDPAAGGLSMRSRHTSIIVGRITGSVQSFARHVNNTRTSGTGNTWVTNVATPGDNINLRIAGEAGKTIHWSAIVLGKLRLP